MAKKSLNQYAGLLSSAKIVEGMNAANENAKRLCEDAELLLSHLRYPRAVGLAILSIEESGKVSILREMSLCSDDKELKKIWRRYRSHTEKNIAWILPDLVLKGARKMSDFREIFNRESDHPQILEQVKQISFYSDCLGNANWSIPDNVIDEALAKSLVQISRIFISKKNISAKEIELWKKNLGPIWSDVTTSLKKEDINRLQEAVESFEKEMLIAGLKANDDEKLSDFIQDQKTRY